MFLSRPPRGGLVPKTRLMERVSLFHNGQWSDSVERSAVDAETAHLAASRKRRRAKSGMEHRASRALRCVLDGELSAGQALKGAEVAPRTRETVDALRERRPTEPREPLPDRVANHVLDSPVSLDSDHFARTLRSSRRGAPGPSGMTAEHLRPMLESGPDTELLATFLTRSPKGEVRKRLSTPSAWGA